LNNINVKRDPRCIIYGCHFICTYKQEICKLTTLQVDHNNKSFIDWTIPQLKKSIQCFLSACLTLSTMNISSNPLFLQHLFQILSL
jgi:hypothetical protein